MTVPLTISDYIHQLRDIPAWHLTMGRCYFIDDRKGRYADELPPHLVSISAFQLEATPVTVGMWREYVSHNRRHRMSDPHEWGWMDDPPMVNVNWLDIVGKNGKNGFLAWASKVVGVRLQLPSEAWSEYAARGGKDVIYPWGDTFDASKFWCSNGAYKKLPSSDTNHKIADQDPTGPAHGEFCRIRGGSWHKLDTNRFRCTNRGASRAEQPGGTRGG